MRRRREEEKGKCLQGVPGPASAHSCAPDLLNQKQGGAQPSPTSAPEDSGAR